MSDSSSLFNFSTPLLGTTPASDCLLNKVPHLQLFVCIYFCCLLTFNMLATETFFFFSKPAPPFDLPLSASNTIIHSTTPGPNFRVGLPALLLLWTTACPKACLPVHCPVSSHLPFPTNLSPRSNSESNPLRFTLLQQPPNWFHCFLHSLENSSPISVLQVLWFIFHFSILIKIHQPLSHAYCFEFGIQNSPQSLFKYCPITPPVISKIEPSFDQLLFLNMF